MPISLGSTDINKIYLGTTKIQKVYLGTTQIYSSSILSRPEEGTYSNSSKVVFMPSNDPSFAYKIRGGPTPNSPTTVTLGDWKDPFYTISAGDTVEVFVEHVGGDMEREDSDARDTWIQIYPANILRSWSAEDSTSIKVATFKFTLRDNNSNTLEFWAICSNDNDTTIITYTDPTTGGGGGGGGGLPVEEDPFNPGEFENVIE